MEPVERLRNVLEDNIGENVNDRSCSVYADEGDLTCRLMRLLDYGEHQTPEFHSHFNATFAYRQSKRRPSKFEGPLRESIDRFVPWWERKGKQRYAFTVDILTHRLCSYSVPSELGVEVKFHRTWTSSVSIRRVLDDLYSRILS